MINQMLLLKIEAIQLRDTVDKGSKLDPQSPAVFFFIGDVELKTRRAIHSGIHANFSEVFDLEIDGDDYEAGKLQVEVEVFNKGFTGIRNYHVGMVKNSLKSLIPQLNERVNVSMDLVHISKTGEVQRGQVLYTATLFDAERAKEILITPAKLLESVAVEKLTDESKAEFISQVFGDVGELNDDFHCALQTKIITHGRLYITNRYVLFYSKLFGGETKLRIPFHQIKAVVRGMMVMPLLILDTDLKKYTFHSFWDFEVGFRAMLGHFEKHKQDLDDGSSTDSMSLSRPRSNSSVVDIEDVHEEPVTPVEVTAESLELFKAASTKSKYKITVIVEQTLPVSVKTFAKLFIEEGAPFTYKAYHESVKDNNVVVTAWQSVGSNEMGREIKFFKPVNLPGLASTRGVKLQNYKRFGEVGLLLSSSTRLEDVPAADCFSVDDTLEVQAAGPDAVTVTISFQVTFVKSTMMKAFIESPTNSEMKKWLAAFFEHLKKKCVEKPDGAAKAEPDPTAPVTPVVTNNTLTVVENINNNSFTAPVQTVSSPLSMLTPGLLAVLLVLLVLALWKISALQSKVDRIEALLAQIASKQ